MLKKIVVTGGKGRFARELSKINTNYNFIFRNKRQLNILSLKSIQNNIKKFKPHSILHLAGMSRPMAYHETKINQSIDLNIIGTCNLVKACSEKNIKLIFFSTSYVYAGKKGSYKEEDPVLPWNNYGWSKLGAESAVQMYSNSLIIRACMTEKPFIHSHAYNNVKSNFIFHDEIAKIFLKIINKRGVINVGGKSQSIYNFAKRYKKDVKKKISTGEFPKKMDMNLNKLRRILRK